VTTTEQTVLDLAHRPDLEELTRAAVDAALRTLGRQCDPVRSEELAVTQRRRAALTRFRAVLDARGRR
jgi:hypothetical protein